MGRSGASILDSDTPHVPIDLDTAPSLRDRGLAKSGRSALTTIILIGYTWRARVSPAIGLTNSVPPTLASRPLRRGHTTCRNTAREGPIPLPPCLITGGAGASTGVAGYGVTAHVGAGLTAFSSIARLRHLHSSFPSAVGKWVVGRLHHRSAARQPSAPDRARYRAGLDSLFRIVSWRWDDRPMCRAHVALLHPASPDQAVLRHRCGHRPAGEAIHQPGTQLAPLDSRRAIT